jgi:hypothetical protein
MSVPNERANYRQKRAKRGIESCLNGSGATRSLVSCAIRAGYEGGLSFSEEADDQQEKANE